jgi:phage baseplate assembly protein W
MREDPSFLGRGWSFPPRFGAGGAEVAMVAGAEDIHQSLQIIFATELGERVMREDFGCSLASFVFEEIDQTLLTRLRSAIADSILYHETRIRLDSVDITENRDIAGLLQIAIHYTVRATNSRFNMVYPFYLKEATAAGR